MRKYKWLIIAMSLVFIISSSAYLYSMSNDKLVTTSSNSSDKTNKKEYKHTLPNRVSKNDYLKGEFISNDIASIYPRRDALVRDILVDIGDEVKSGDTLAILFNPGVGGEGQSKINIKSTIVSSKNNLLDDVINVKNAKIAEIDQKILESEIILEETTNNFDSKISQIGNEQIDGSEYSVQVKILNNLKNNTSNAKNSKEELLNESSNNITQKEELLGSKIDEIYNKIVPILFIGNESDLDYSKINNSSFSDTFGIKDSTSRNIFISKIINFRQYYDSLDIEKKYTDLLEINNQLISMLHNTIVSVSTDENKIETHISSINTYNTSLISQKEILDDAKNMYLILEATQKEKIENLELLVLKKENEIVLLGTKSSTTESEKKLGLSKLKASIETLKKSKDLLIASENKSITTLKNEIAIAIADLSSESIKSGDYKIISPFTGTISKRGIDIGEKISPSMEAFRLSGVQTTLSRITKKEVKFFVPENLKDNLEMGKEIIFSTGGDEVKSFTGTIYRISPEVDENTLNITVQAKVSDQIKLPNKSTLRVNLETKQEIFKIPSSTIYNKGERKIIYYKKENGKLGVRDINIISDESEYSLVSGKITENLKIVTTPIFIK